jgi:hypothetical protein
MKHAVSLEREKKMWIMIAYTTFELQLIIVSIYMCVATNQSFRYHLTG